MRIYTPKDDVQQKSYYNDRFFITPELPKINPSEDEIYASDIEIFGAKFNVLECYIQAQELVIYINPKANKDAIKFLRDELEYDFLMELSAIDYIAARGGFEIFYEMLSTSKHKRIRLKCFIEEKEEIESVESIFKMANWSEREMYDMYGVKAANHHNLKRILMPDDWYDYPLKKSYPLHGDETAQWYEVDKIFGKEARDIIGPEERDSAAVDRYDTNRFARLGHEVDLGVDITDGKEPEHTPISYQEEGGVKLFGKRLVKELDPKKSVTLDKRR